MALVGSPFWWLLPSVWESAAVSFSCSTIAFADFESTRTGKKDFAFDAFEEDKEGLWFSHFRRSMNPRRDMRNNRVALFDGIEEGGIRASSSYSHEIDEHENERAMEGLQDRVNLLKRLSGDIHEEVDSHNRMLDRMGNDMDSSRGILSGTMDKFKMVFETKSSRRMFTLVASFVVIFLVIYYLTNDWQDHRLYFPVFTSQILNLSCKNFHGARRLHYGLASCGGVVRDDEGKICTHCGSRVSLV
ncbi:hypothetical protein V6N11_016091 [Hibiscus sabdariffa]|uniref:t-SNARE coiled-coil homology domain-containing protein n=1 Tax=Hibiscus sabdariffa TaxID=183260 RepID=A0ABR2TUU2_9ROSI